MSTTPNIEINKKNDSKMIALALVNALLVLLGGVDGKDAWGVSRSELTDKEGDLEIRSVACPSKAIFLSASSSAVNQLYDYRARGFWLSDEDMNEMIGNRDWNGKTFDVIQRRGGKVQWSGRVIVWNVRGRLAYGRRYRGAKSGQWDLRDRIELKSCEDKATFMCPSGYGAVSENLGGTGKVWAQPHPDSTRTIYDCASICDERQDCTGFEFAEGDSETGACGTYTGGDGNLLKDEGRLDSDSNWRSCIKFSQD